MSIFVPRRFYIDYQRRTEHGDTIKLGFATDADKEDAAFEKRKETITRWASETSHEYQKDEDGNYKRVEVPKEFFAEVLSNESQSGFKIPRSVRRWGWNGGNVLWRVEDPRGFELEIPSENMGQLLMHCTIINGEIQEQCVWGWNKKGGSRVVLLPVNSEPYLEAMKSTKLRNSSVSLREVNIGDRIVLKNGAEGIYYGKHHILKTEYMEQSPYKHGSLSNVFVEDLLLGSNFSGKRITTIHRHLLKLADGNWFAQSDFKVSLVKEKCTTPPTHNETIIKVNQSLLSGKRLVETIDSSEWSYKHNLGEIAVVRSKEERGSMALKAATFDEIKQYVETNSRSWYLVVFKYPNTENYLMSDYIQPEHFKTRTISYSNVLGLLPQYLENQQIVWGKNPRAFVRDFSDTHLDEDLEYFMIVYTVEGQTFVVSN